MIRCDFKSVSFRCEGTSYVAECAGMINTVWWHDGIFLLI